MKKRLRVALIAGGRSGEREVSLAGARGVEENLDRERYQVVRYDPATDLARLAADSGGIDVAFILLHGPLGEDGSMQGFLDLLGIPYQGSGVLGSAMAMDKEVAKTVYRAAGLPTPDWRMLAAGDDGSVEAAAAELGLPLVVKPVGQGSSLGMSIVREGSGLAAAVARAFEHGGRVMLERFVKGREITVGVLGNDDPVALPLVEIIPGEEFEFFDYRAKYTPGASREVCPAEIDPEIAARAQRMGIAAHQALKLSGYSRTDMLVDDTGEIFVIETNTIPGMTPTSLFPQAAAAAGLDFPALLDRLIELALQETGDRRQETGRIDT